MAKTICPECKKSDYASKVLVSGFPMKTCDRCEMFWGFWSFVPVYIGFDGSYIQYDDGAFLKALKAWVLNSD